MRLRRVSEAMDDGKAQLAVQRGQLAKRQAEVCFDARAKVYKKHGLHEFPVLAPVLLSVLQGPPSMICRFSGRAWRQNNTYEGKSELIGEPLQIEEQSKELSAAEAAGVHHSTVLEAQEKALQERQRELEASRTELSAKVSHYFCGTIHPKADCLHELYAI